MEYIVVNKNVRHTLNNDIRPNFLNVYTDFFIKETTRTKYNRLNISKINA